MIIKESFSSPTATIPLIKIYSDSNFFLQRNGQFYQEVILPNEEMAHDYIETNVAIPAPVADEVYIYRTLIGEYQNITQEEIKKGKEILLKALFTLNDEEAYQVKFFFDEWQPNIAYQPNTRIWYDNELYTVINTPDNNISPKDNTKSYMKTHKPDNLIEEWDSVNKKTYNKGDRVKIGKHYYESTMDNNTWSPQEFPASWRLI